MIKFEFNGKKYELVKKTIAITELISEIGKDSTKVDTGLMPVKAFVEKAINFINTTVTAENASESMLGTADINEVDCNDVTLALLTIMEAYKKPIQEANAKRAEAAYNNDQFKNVMEILNAVKAAKSMEKEWADE